MTTLQLQREAPRLVAKYPHLIWKKAQAERRLKRRHAFTLKADQRYVAELCLSKTCERFDVSRNALLGNRRFWRLVQTRHIAMTAAYELSGLSSIVLGVKFRRGHDMILWAQKRVNGTPSLRIQADTVIRAVKKELKRCSDPWGRRLA